MSSVARRRRVAVIFNPVSGPGQRRRAARLKEILRSWDDVDVDWSETTETDPGTEMTREALARGAEVVLVYGGDGTVMACAAVLVGSSVPLAVIPGGTGNIIGVSLGISSHLEAAVEVALGPGRARLDLCLDVESRPFFAGSIGMTASIMQGARRGWKDRLGMTAYALSALRHLFHGATEFRVTMEDGTEVIRRAQAVLVGNYAGMIKEARLTSPHLDDGVVEIGFLDLRPLPRWLPGARPTSVRRALEWHQTPHQVVIQPGSDVAPVEQDGDWRGRWPCQAVSVLPGAISVCVPTESVRGRFTSLLSLALKDLVLLADPRGKSPR